MCERPFFEDAESIVALPMKGEMEFISVNLDQ